MPWLFGYDHFLLEKLQSKLSFNDLNGNLPHLVLSLPALNAASSFLAWTGWTPGDTERSHCDPHACLQDS